MRTNLWWNVGIGLLLWFILVLAGCAGAGGGPQEYEPGQAAISSVPPSFYGDSSTLEHWYTPPYWQPDAD